MQHGPEEVLRKNLYFTHQEKENNKKSKTKFHQMLTVPMTIHQTLRHLVARSQDDWKMLPIFSEHLGIVLSQTT